MRCGRCRTRYEATQAYCPRCGTPTCGSDPSRPRSRFQSPEWFILGVVGGAGCLLLLLWVSVMPARNQSWLRKERRRCESNLKRLAHGMILYAGEHGDFLPAGEPMSWEEAVAKYDVPLYCPLTERTVGESDYLFLGSGMEFSRVEHPDRTPLFICKSADYGEGRRNVGFFDGHVEAVVLPEKAGCEEIVRLLLKEPPEWLLENARTADAGK